jgi:hypothetical protein
LVGVDVLPLLVRLALRSASGSFLRQKGYVQEPHRGGLAVEQPDRSFSSPGPPPRTHASS